MNLFSRLNPPIAKKAMSWRPLGTVAKSVAVIFASVGIAAAAPSTTVVISQVYGGGGNSGATYNQDFVEIHNISGSPVSVNGWSIQYAAAAGTSWSVCTLPNVEIPAGKYFLAALAATSGSTAQALPTADVTATNINMSGTAGKVALVNATTALTTANPAGTTTVVDLVGFGTAAVTGYEGTGPIVGALTTTTSVHRKNAGSTDTDSNPGDLEILSVAPRNSATAAFIPSTGGADVTKPTATLSPLDNATDVSLSTTLSLAFSETVVAGTGSLTLHTSAGTVATIPASSAVFSGNTATFTLSSPLTQSTEYYVQVDGAAFKDTAGNFYLGVTDTTSWTFTTTGPDVTGPAPVKYTPAAGSSDASATEEFSPVVGFGEIITRSVGGVTLHKASDDSLVETLDEEDILIGGLNDSASFFFDTILTAGETYTVKVEANSFLDATGNPNAAFQWSFTAFNIGNLKIAVNEFFNNGTSDVVELLVIASGQGTTTSVEGMLLKDYSGSGVNDVGGAYIFKASTPEAPTPWASLKAGTLIVLTNSAAGVPPTAAEDLDGSDFVIRANLRNSALFTAGTGGFDIGGTEVVQIKAAGSAQAGSAGAIHTLADTAPTAAQYAAAPPPKATSTGASSNISIINATGTLSDFNGDTAASSTLPSSLGLANSVGNAAYIDSLRGTLSVTIGVANASKVIPENAPVQTDALTITMPSVVTSDTTVTLSASPAGILSLPATVVVPSGSNSVTVSFTPINDGVVTGNRVATVSASRTGFTTGTVEITAVEIQYVNPPVVINKYQNGAVDAIELLVIQDGANLVGMTIKDFSGDMGGDGGGSYTFKNVPLWQSLPSGTLVVLSAGTTAVEDFDASDFVVRVNLASAAAPAPANTYFTANGGAFDISGSDMIMLKKAGAPVSGTEGSIHTLAGGVVFGSTPPVPGPLFAITAAPKLYAAMGGTGVIANNTNSVLSDFNGTDATGGTDLTNVTAFPALGSPNNATNETYILSLRAASTPLAPSVTSSLTATATVGTAFTYTITATGSPTSYNATGLPTGLTIGTATGIISGTPTVSGPFTIALSATNGVGTGTANLALTVNTAGGTYSSWATTNAGGQAASLDFDKDGVPNGVEYFFGATGSTFTPNPSVVAGKITWPMSATATGVTYKVQTSTTLASGGWTDVAQSGLVVTAGTPTGTVAYTLPTSGPKLFVRLVVTAP